MQPGQDLYFVGFLSTARTRAQEGGAWPSEEDTQFGTASLNPNLGSNCPPSPPPPPPPPPVLLAQVAKLVAHPHPYPPTLSLVCRVVVLVFVSLDQMIHPSSKSWHMDKNGSMVAGKKGDLGRNQYNYAKSTSIRNCLIR